MMDHYQFYLVVPLNRFTAAHGGTAGSPVNMPAVWSLPTAVGARTWQTPGGTATNRDVIFGAVKDEAGASVADWWHRPSWDDVFYGGEYHGSQIGPTRDGPKLRHVASGNEFFVAKFVHPHVPLMAPMSDGDPAGLFQILDGPLNFSQSTMTKLANNVGDYVGWRDWRVALRPQVIAGNLEVLGE